jgi:hypothetical protein
MTAGAELNSGGVASSRVTASEHEAIIDATRAGILAS